MGGLPSCTEVKALHLHWVTSLLTGAGVVLRMGRKLVVAQVDLACWVVLDFNGTAVAAVAAPVLRGEQQLPVVAAQVVRVSTVISRG